MLRASREKDPSLDSFQERFGVDILKHSGEMLLVSRRMAVMIRIIIIMVMWFLFVLGNHFSQTLFKGQGKGSSEDSCRISSRNMGTFMSRMARNNAMIITQV